jgi:predicted alpha-1,6-mannanase (GH76 family)
VDLTTIIVTIYYYVTLPQGSTAFVTWVPPRRRTDRGVWPYIVHAYFVERCHNAKLHPKKKRKERANRSHLQITCHLWQQSQLFSWSYCQYLCNPFSAQFALPVLWTK